MLPRVKQMCLPHDAIHDDYNIYAEIQYLLTHMAPLTPKFHHIKGCQDQQTDHQ